MQVKNFVIIVLLISSIHGLAQSNYVVNLVGSYQFQERQSLYLGASRNKELTWPDWDIDLYMISSMYGETYIADPEINNIYAVGFNFLLGIEYAYIGFNERMSFQESANRVDFGPLVRVGYKYIWLEYSRYFLGFENLFSKSSTHTVKLNDIESNLRIVLTIPIYTKS